MTWEQIKNSDSWYDNKNTQNWLTYKYIYMTIINFPTFLAHSNDCEHSVAMKYT